MIQYLEAAAKELWSKRQYSDAADILFIATKHCYDDEMLNGLLSNARMCYFLANDVPKAYDCLIQQEKLGITTGWELQRDKANYLRYLNGHEQAYEIVRNLPDNDTKFLALSWFMHNEGKFKEAFAMAELGRKNNYWWGPRQKLNLPVWDGSYQENIVIVGESGSGDEIIFSRWIPEVAQRCENLYYYTHTDIFDVFNRNFGIKKLSEYSGDSIVMAPSMSLPYILGSENPSPLKYLSSNSDIKVSFPQDKFKIGLCFHGDPTHHETTLRTIPQNLLVDAFSDLGVLINLQKDTKQVHSKLLYPKLDTWEQTFAVLDQCDLVVTCDTSISHAAGALGKNVILLMHAAAYFTWNHREEIGRSSWYENAWCVKQTVPCRWEGCIDRSKQLAKKILNGEINDT